jgi:hypothetical protein
MKESENLRSERLSLLIGTIIGQISELLNYIERGEANINAVYEGLFDIHKAAALQIHNLYYKDNKQDAECG